LLKIGGLFFVIQIGALVLFETDNIVITQMFGPKDVTIFNVAYKLFSVVVMVSMIVLNPFWSAFTEAYSKNNFDWIKSAMKKLYYYLAAACLISFLLFITSPFIYKIWLGKQIKVPMLLSLVMAFQVMGHCWLIINCFFLNGIGKIKLQFYLYIICMIVNIPLSIFFCRIMGSLVGVTISNLLIFIYMNIVLYSQCKKILNRTAEGIWNK
ncbi:MAG: lipopolysaccharide biosynthesis protein, partial [Bacteroidia bacterium]